MTTLPLTKKKLEAIDMLISYYIGILELLDNKNFKAWFSNHGNYLFLNTAEVNLAIQSKNSIEDFNPINDNITSILSLCSDIRDLKKSVIKKIGLNDINNEIEDFYNFKNYQKSFLVIIGEILTLKKRYKRFQSTLKRVTKTIDPLPSYYHNPIYYNTTTPFNGHDLEMFFECDLEIINTRITDFILPFDSSLLKRPKGQEISPQSKCLAYSFLINETYGSFVEKHGVNHGSLKTYNSRCVRQKMNKQILDNRDQIKLFLETNYGIEDVERLNVKVNELISLNSN